jgi:hypothetical protein
MQPIIAPIDTSVLKGELTKERFLRSTNKGDNELYVVNNKNAPNVLQEIGRLREEAFRAGGGGTGLAIDLDEFDTEWPCYEQLIVWDPEAEQIIGGYRFIICTRALKDNKYNLSTKHFFAFSTDFETQYLPTTIELGRSFVQPAYQSKDGNRKGLFSLDNLWDGLGALVILNPSIHYFFGKVTIYKQYNTTARNLLFGFMHHYFPDKEHLVTSHANLKIGITEDVSNFVQKLHGLAYKEGHSLLSATIKNIGENIPPLVNSYMNLSPTMKTFETAINKEFGEVYETGILVDIRDIYDSKKERHVDTFVPNPLFK